MTIPSALIDQSAISVPRLPNDAGIAAIVPNDLYAARVKMGQREIVFSQYDLRQASMAGGQETAPTWSDPKLVIETFRLGQLVNTSERLLRDMFGSTATLRPAIERDPESGRPTLILWLTVPYALRQRRYEYLERYARDTVIPKGAPVPGMLWDFPDAVSS